MSTETQTKEATVVVLPFGIEADHPRNCDLRLQCLHGEILRSAFDGTKGTVDRKSGDLRVPLGQSQALASFPRTPGMQLHVNPQALTYVIIDPLTKDEAMCLKIQKFINEAGGFSTDKVIRGVPTKEGKLDVHRMKSLCREMMWLVNSKEARIVKGTLPDEDDLQQLPGHFLLNPGSVVGNTQPVYEKDFPAWVSNLSHTGG